MAESRATSAWFYKIPQLHVYLHFPLKDALLVPGTRWSHVARADARLAEEEDVARRPPDLDLSSESRP